MPSDFDESTVCERDPESLATHLAAAKGEAVVPRVDGDAVLVACDSVLEYEGIARGKPRTPERAIEAWQRIRGHQGTLHTGHYVWVRRGDDVRTQLRTASTIVKFADVTDEEIEAYVATGEPAAVAGGFTIDGYGGAFITGVMGDPHNVIGISLPLFRQMLLDLGVPWTSLWRQPTQPLKILDPSAG